VAAGLYAEVPLYVAAQLVGAFFAAALYRRFWVRQPIPASGSIGPQRNSDRPRNNDFQRSKQ